MEQFARTGEFCPNEGCADYGKLQAGQPQRNMKKSGKTQRDVQRYQCKTCGKTLTATTGTRFFRKRTPEHQILETLALLAEGSRISSLSRVKGIKEATILQWLREAACHAEHLEEVLLRDFKVTRGQLDALWVYVCNTGKKTVRAIVSSDRLWYTALSCLQLSNHDEGVYAHSEGLRMPASAPPSS